MARRVAATGLRTKRAVLREFAHHASLPILGGSILATLAARLVAVDRPIGRQDVVALVVVLALQPVAEWGLHRFVLHAPARRIVGVRIDPGASHRGHHRRPDDVGGLLLGAAYAVADGAALVIGALAVGGAASIVMRSSPWPAALTGAGAALGALLWYEWAHLLQHSGYRPRTAWFRSLRAQHLRHHHRDEAAGFGITSQWVDRRLGTRAVQDAV
jgi:sterol desaturase/sphingolipid hydroxylase (fatty acid hydroxylase superfamily)